MVCTFFGHRNVPSGVRVTLETVLMNLIENNGAAQFQAMAQRKGKTVINLYEHEKR